MSVDIEQKVKNLIINELSVEESELTPEASFIKDLGADSLASVELVMKLEDEFDIKIEEDEAEKITTVGAAIDFIKSKMA